MEGRIFGAPKRWILVLLLALLLGSTPAVIHAQGIVVEEEGPPAGPQVQVLSANPETLVVEWRSPTFSMEEVSLEGRTYLRIVAPEMGLTGEAGHPQLPAGGVWLGLPPNTAVEVVILEAEAEEISLSRPVLPVPQALPPEPRPDEGGGPWPEEPAYRYLPDAGVYGSAAAYPGTLARIEGEGWIRSQRVGLLRFYPFQYEPARNLLHIYRRLRVEVRFGPAPQGGPTVAEPAPFEALFQEMLINADQARLWRSADAPVALPASLPIFPPRPAVRVQVDHDGFYRLSLERLRQAGVPIDEVDLSTLRLFLDGQEVALWVPDELPHPGDPAGALFFYGQGARSRYTSENTYWLTWGEGAGRRMAERSGQPVLSPPLGDFVATVHRESNTQYTSLFPIGGDDVERWFWACFYTGGVREGTFSLGSLFPAQVPYTATLRLSFHGGFAAWPNPDHHVQVYLNDTFLGDGWWDGQTPFTLELSVPQALLQAGENRVRLYAPGDTGYSYDFFYLDWIELTYRRTFAVENDRLEFTLAEAGGANVSLEPFTGEDILVLDISDPLNPVRIVEGVTEATAGGYRYTFAHRDNGAPSRYLAVILSQAEEPPLVQKDQPSDLHAPDNGADVLLISPAELIPAIQPLAADYAGRGMRARVVDVQDIYDEFSGGRRDPHAIRSFLAYAYAHWVPPAPTYVLLVGDGHYDFKDYLGNGLPNLIPPYLAYVDPWMGETAADNRYVSLVGNDVLADMFLGRLPVNSPQEATAVVDKVLAYRQVKPADWQGQVLFVADNADGAGNFAALSDEIANFYLPAYYTADKVYLGVNYPYENPAVTARAAILQALNSGRLLLNYVGHGAIYFLAAERLLQAGDVDSLSNGHALPVLLSWSCYAGLYSLPYPSSPALGEVWVRAPNRGAIAAWVPTGLGLAWAHHDMNKGVFEALFLGRFPTLGQAALAGNLRLYAAAPSMGYQLETYVLLGDPTLEVPVLPTDLYLEAGSAIPNPAPAGGVVTLTLSLGNAGPATAYDAVLRAELPAGWSLRDWTSAGNLPLTLASADPPTWKAPAVSPASGSTLLLRLQAGMEGGNWPLIFTVESGSREIERGNNTLRQEVSVVLAGQPERLLVEVNPPSIPSGGQALLTATVLDAFGRPVPDGTVVTFAASQGQVWPPEVTTLRGQAQARFLAGGGSGEVWITVRSGSARSLVYIRILPTPGKRPAPGPATGP